VWREAEPEPRVSPSYIVMSTRPHVGVAFRFGYIVLLYYLHELHPDYQTPLAESWSSVGGIRVPLDVHLSK
jgi:hypothetical protein